MGAVNCVSRCREQRLHRAKDGRETTTRWDWAGMNLTVKMRNISGWSLWTSVMSGFSGFSRGGNNGYGGGLETTLCARAVMMVS